MVAVTSPKSGLVGAGSFSTKRTLGDVSTHSILETTVWVKTLTEWNGCRNEQRSKPSEVSLTLQRVLQR